MLWVKPYYTNKSRGIIHGTCFNLNIVSHKYFLLNILNCHGEVFHQKSFIVSLDTTFEKWHDPILEASVGPCHSR